MNGPSTLCIGAQKAGTTWLYRCLENRPDVWLPPVKELHFFDEKIGSSDRWIDHMHGTKAPAARWRRQLAAERQRRARNSDIDDIELARRAWCSRYFFEDPTVDWYRSLFPDRAVASLDISPEYALLDEAGIERVITVVPDIRVIYLLRNPIEREWSGAQMRFRKNPDRGLETVLAGRHRHVRYLDTVDRWTAALEPEHFYIGWFDDIAAHPAELLADIARFIGADPNISSLPRGRPNSGNVTTIPAEFAQRLAIDLHDEIDGLARRFDGPARRWAQLADQLHSSEPVGDIAYPLAGHAERGSETISSMIL